MPQLTATIMAIAITITPVPSYDITLSPELEEHTYSACATYGLEYELMLAVMWRETRFTEGLTSNHGAVGICQVMPLYHLQTALDIGLDIYDTKDNITYSAYFLSGLIEDYGETKALAVYNAGFTGGGYGYAEEVLNHKEVIKEYGTISD